MLGRKNRLTVTFVHHGFVGLWCIAIQILCLIRIAASVVVISLMANNTKILPSSTFQGITDVCCSMYLGYAEDFLHNNVDSW